MKTTARFKKRKRDRSAIKAWPKRSECKSTEYKGSLKRQITTWKNAPRFFISLSPLFSRFRQFYCHIYYYAYYIVEGRLYIRRNREPCMAIVFVYIWFHSHIWQSVRFIRVPGFSGGGNRSCFAPFACGLPFVFFWLKCCFPWVWGFQNLTTFTSKYVPVLQGFCHSGCSGNHYQQNLKRRIGENESQACWCDRIDFEGKGQIKLNTK